MGEVRATIEIRGVQANGSTPQRLEAFADTGATLSMLPESLLTSAGIKPDGRVQMLVADGRTLERKTGHAWITVNDDSTITRIVFGEPDDARILGLAAMEQIGIMVDPVNRRLVPAGFKAFQA